MKTLLFSKFTIIFGLALASALSVRHFAPFPQQHVRPDSISPITQPMAVGQPDQPPVNDLTEPQAIEVEDQPSHISIATVRVPPVEKQAPWQSLDEGNDRIDLAIAHITSGGIAITGATPISGAPPSTEGNTNDRQPLGEKDLSHVGGTNGPPPPKVSGQTNFSLISATQPNAPQTFPGPGGNGPLAATLATNSGSTTTPRAVTESDIWKIRGNTLYFFNQLRGLQIIDITNPDAPARVATLPLPAVGEEMYILDDTHVLLLAQKRLLLGSQ